LNLLPALLLTLAAVPPFGNPFAPPGQNRPTTPVHHDSRDQVTLTVEAQRKQVTPGQDTAIAVVFNHNDGWHIHTNAPVVPPELGEASDFIATAIVIDAPADGSLKPLADWIQWPESHDVEVAFGGTPVLYGVWEGKAVAYVPIHVSNDAPLGTATLVVHAVFQACDEFVCIAPTPMPPSPGGTPSTGWTKSGIAVSFDIVAPETIAAVAGSEGEPRVFGNFDQSVFGRIASGDGAPAGVNDVRFNAFGIAFDLNANSTFELILLLLVAAFGGFLLNLTPCVLPVIPLKIMALANASHSRGRTMVLGLAMAVGVTAFWIGIGLAIALLTGFTASNQLFQYPWFTLGVGVIIAAMAVGMCGLFTMRLPNAVYMISPKHDTLSGSFLFGIMTAVLSTPCTAPFMGAAMAWAATESPSITMVTFAAIGVGMAVPYLVLAMFPTLTDRMPKAGPASELIKQVLGGLMLAAAVFFIGVGISGMLVEPPEPPSRSYFWVVAAVLVANGLWLLIRTWALTANASSDATKRRWRPTGTLLALAMCFLAVLGASSLTDHGPISWVYYKPDRLASALQDDKAVVLEFTAEWCLNCKVLEKTVLADPDVVAALSQGNVVPMKIDLTGNNEEGNAMLHKVGRHQIPLLVVLAPDGTEVFKGDFYTVSQVVDAIERATRK
jgi:thiol:disulfide interchange protein DsbD